MFDLGERITQHVDRAAPPIDLAEIQVRVSPAARGLTAREDEVPGKRSLLVFATAFVGVLVAGAAFAQVGAFAPDEPTDPPAAARQEVDQEPPGEPEPAASIPEDDLYVESTTPHEDPEREPDPEEESGAPEEEPPLEDQADTTPPEFVILHPDDGQRFEMEKVAFEGEVEPGARVFAGDWEADVTAEGHWRIVLILNEGQNAATLTAVDGAGNAASATVTVHYDPPQPIESEEPPKEEPPAEERPKEEPPAEQPPKEEPPAEEPPKEEPPAEGPPAEEPPAEGGEASEEPASFSFTANQQFGSCAEDLPYDVFWGTADPGSAVYIASDFGSGTTTANGDGHWEIRVDFPNAPFNHAFNVVAEADGGRKVFSFIRTGGDG